MLMVTNKLLTYNDNYVLHFDTIVRYQEHLYKLFNRENFLKLILQE